MHHLTLMVGSHDVPPLPMQEALPAQIHVVYIIQPGHFWKKTATSRGHNKEKKKLEFSVSHASAFAPSCRSGETSLERDGANFFCRK